MADVGDGGGEAMAAVGFLMVSFDEGSPGARCRDDHYQEEQAACEGAAKRDA
jgi:hypothetical protein